MASSRMLLSPPFVTLALLGQLTAQVPPPVPGPAPAGQDSGWHSLAPQWRSKLEAAAMPSDFGAVLRELAAVATTAEAAASLRSLADVVGGAKVWSDLDRKKLEPLVVAATGQQKRPPAALPALWALRRSEPSRATWSVLDVEMLLSFNDMAGALRAIGDAPSLVFEDGDDAWTLLTKGLGLFGAGLDILQGIRSGWVVATRLGFVGGQLGAGVAPQPLTESEIRFLVQLGHVHEALRLGEQAKCLAQLQQLTKEHPGHPLFAALLAEVHASLGPAFNPARASSLFSQLHAATSDKKVLEAEAAKAWNVPELLYYYRVLTGREVPSLVALREHAKSSVEKMTAKIPQALAPDYVELSAAVKSRRQQAAERLADLQACEGEVKDLELKIEAKKRERPTGQDGPTIKSSELGTLSRKLSRARNGVTNAKAALERQQKFLDLCEPKLAELENARRRG